MVKMGPFSLKRVFGADPSADFAKFFNKALNDLIESMVTKNYSRIKDIDVIMPQFESVLPCNSSGAT